LFVSTPIEYAGLQVLPAQPQDYPIHHERQHVMVAVDVLEADRARVIFGVDLLGHGIQPLLMRIQNDSDQPYHVQKAWMNLRVHPAIRVARYASQGPTKTAMRNVRWLLFLVPGVVFSSLIEPLTTIDFPAMQEAARRPPKPVNRQIEADFAKAELPDAVIGPGESVAGVVFASRLRGDRLLLTLTNAQTQEPLTIEVRLSPPELDSQTHEYAVPYATVWKAAVRAASSVRSWTVRSISTDHGVITVTKGLRWWPWIAQMQLAVTVEQIDAARTQVRIFRVMPKTQAVVSAGKQVGIDRFFQELETVLPAPVPPPQPVVAQPGTPAPSNP